MASRLVGLFLSLALVIIIVAFAGVAGGDSGPDKTPVDQSAEMKGTEKQPDETRDEEGVELARVLTLVYSGTLLLLTIGFAIACVYSVLSTGEWPEVESHWGGLGGGLGGFRISPALLFLVAAITFAAFLSGTIEKSLKAINPDPSVDDQHQVGDRKTSPESSGQKSSAKDPAGGGRVGLSATSPHDHLHTNRKVVFGFSGG